MLIEKTDRYVRARDEKVVPFYFFLDAQSLSVYNERFLDGWDLEEVLDEIKGDVSEELVETFPNVEEEVIEKILFLCVDAAEQVLVDLSEG